MYIKQPISPCVAFRQHIKSLAFFVFRKIGSMLCTLIVSPYERVSASGEYIIYSN